MRNGKVLAAAAAGAVAATLGVSVARAQYGPAGGGGFSLERWEEDYSYLKDSRARTDPFDPVKYVPLSASGDSWVSFGGQARYRYDYFNNRSFGAGKDDEDGWHLQRYLAHADVHAGDHVRAFVQVDSSFIDGRVGGGRYGDADNFDLQQGFVDLKTSDDAQPFFMARVGRQELVYGAERLVSPDDWRNVRRSFDGGKVVFAVPNDTVEVFLTRPVFIEKEQFDDDDPGQVFAGVYNVTALPSVFEKGGTKLELYWLGLWQTRHSDLAAIKADTDVQTFGARFVTRPKPWDFDVEADWQGGDYAGRGLSAWSVATEVGYTVEGWALEPRFSLGLDAASGSGDGSERFNQLFPPTYTYLGHLYLFGRPNVVDLHGGVGLNVVEGVKVYVAQHVYWRENTNDGLYDLSGALVRGDNGSDAAYVGTEFDVALTWRLGKHVDGYVGWAHFFSGDFIAETGASGDADFLYTSVSFTF